MEITLDKTTIDAIAVKTTAMVLKALLKKKELLPEMVTTKEAAAILHISPDRMRRIKDRFPYSKSQGGKILFVRDALLSYNNH